MDAEIEIVLRKYLETREESFRGPILVLLNHKIDVAKSNGLQKEEISFKAIRTALSKSVVDFDTLSWILDTFQNNDVKTIQETFS
jgi:hypothetical protein